MARDTVNPDVRVAIVFTEDVSESLTRLASIGHVWVVRSPMNERAVQAYWQNPDNPFSVTLFNESDSAAPAQERLGILGVVEEHRFDYSDEYEYATLEVVGLPLDAETEEYLQAFGFNRFEERSNGFVAHRPAKPHEFV
jgi:hypothetical protein